MNRTCCGTFFSINDRRFYRCLFSGKIFKLDESHENCPECKRKITAKSLLEVPSREVTTITTEVELPEGWFTMDSKQIVSQK